MDDDGLPLPSWPWLISRMRRDLAHRRHEFIKTTPSHEALIALRLPVIFTTKYDELIEAAYVEAGIAIRTSMGSLPAANLQKEVPNPPIVSSQLLSR